MPDLTFFEYHMRRNALLRQVNTVARKIRTQTDPKYTPMDAGYLNTLDRYRIMLLNQIEQLQKDWNEQHERMIYERLQNQQQ